MYLVYVSGFFSPARTRWDTVVRIPRKGIFNGPRFLLLDILIRHDSYRKALPICARTVLANSSTHLSDGTGLPNKVVGIV
jgi:hypothetical protein